MPGRSLTVRRRVAWAVVTTVALLMLAVAAGEWSGWPFLKQPLHGALQRAAGVPVQMDGRLRLHLLWRPRLQIDHLRIAAAPAVPAPHLLDGRHITISWRWSDLWRWRRGGQLVLRSLQAEELDMQLLRQKDGRASWQIGRARLQPPQESQPLPTAGRLEIGSGSLVIDDALRETRVRIEVRGGEGTAQAGAAAGYQATIRGSYREAPVDLTLRSAAALPLLHEDDDGSSPMTALRVEGTAGETRVVFDGQAAALLGARHLDGALRFSGPSLASVGDALGLTLPKTPAFSLLGRLSHHDGLWKLRAERLDVGRSDLAGEFRYDTRTQPPQLSGRATGTHLALADLGPSIGAPAGRGAPRPAQPAASAASAPARRVLPQQRFELPSLRAMDANVELAIDQLVLSTSAVNPLRNLRTRVVLDGGVLELQKLHAEVAGGRLDGMTRLDGRGEPARWAAQLRFGDVDVAGWVRGLRTPEGKRRAPAPNDASALRRERKATRNAAERGAERAEANVPAYLTGELEASVDVKGTGRSTAEILSTLEGPISLTLHDGTMSHLVTEAMGIDIAEALGVVVKGDDVLPLRCARLDFVTHNGVMRLTRGVLDNPDTTIRVAGQVDLRNEQLALAARARPKDVSLASLRSPVFVSGTLSAPQVSIEPSRLAARALGAVALAALVNPLAALIPLIDTGDREPGDPCAAGNAAEPAGKPVPPAAGASAPARSKGASR